jgi:hypothetical protein
MPVRSTLYYSTRQIHGPPLWQPPKLGRIPKFRRWSLGESGTRPATNTSAVLGGNPLDPWPIHLNSRPLHIPRPDRASSLQRLTTHTNFHHRPHARRSYHTLARVSQNPGKESRLYFAPATDSVSRRCSGSVLGGSSCTNGRPCSRILPDSTPQLLSPSRRPFVNRA